MNEVQYVPDNYDMFEQMEREIENVLKDLPVCSECGELIHTDYYYDINGELICEDCMNEYYRKSTDDYERM